MLGEGYHEVPLEDRLDGRMAYHVMQIVDNKGRAPEAGMVNERNLEPILNKASDYLREVRGRRSQHAMQEKGWEGNLPKHIQDLKLMTSASHAIQCSVNGAYDLDFLARHMFQAAKDNGTQASNPELQETLSLLKHTRDAQRMMTKLYEVDVARRFGDLNKNPKIFESSLHKFEAVKPKLVEFLRAFRQRNEGGITEDAEKKIESLEQRIAAATPDELKEVLYDEIIRPLSRMIFFDWNLDSDIIEEHLRNLFPAREDATIH